MAPQPAPAGPEELEEEKPRPGQPKPKPKRGVSKAGDTAETDDDDDEWFKSGAPDEAAGLLNAEEVE